MGRLLGGLCLCHSLHRLLIMLSRHGLRRLLGLLLHCLVLGRLLSRLTAVGNVIALLSISRRASAQRSLMRRRISRTRRFLFLRRLRNGFTAVQA